MKPENVVQVFSVDSKNKETLLFAVGYANFEAATVSGSCFIGEVAAAIDGKDYTKRVFFARFAADDSQGRKDAAELLGCMQKICEEPQDRRLNSYEQLMKDNKNAQVKSRAYFA